MYGRQKRVCYKGSIIRLCLYSLLYCRGALASTKYPETPDRLRCETPKLVCTYNSRSVERTREADEEEENERVLQQQEEEEQTAAIAAATARRKHRSLRERQKLASILDDTNYHRLPSRQRKKINELVDAFLSQLGDDIHAMCTDQRAGANYKGLDS